MTVALQHLNYISNVKKNGTSYVIQTEKKIEFFVTKASFLVDRLDEITRTKLIMLVSMVNSCIRQVHGLMKDVLSAKVEKPENQMVLHVYLHLLQIWIHHQSTFSIYCKEGLMETLSKESKSGFDLYSVSSHSKKEL